MNTKTKATEVDILIFCQKIWDRKFLVIFIGIICAVISFLVSAFLIAPKYQSTTSIYVVNKTNNDYRFITTQDLQAGSFLVNDYKEIVTSTEVLNKVIELEKLQITAKELQHKVSVEIPTNTRIVSITVTGLDPKSVASLADTLREVAIEKIKEVTKLEDVTTLEKAKIPEEPSSPIIKYNVILGLIAGLTLASIVVILVELLDDRIKRSEEVEDILGLPILGVIPQFDKKQ